MLAIYGVTGGIIDESAGRLSQTGKKMSDQFIYIPQSICESHTAAQAIILSDIGYWASSFGSCTNRVTAKEGQRSLANLAGISNRQSSNIIAELVANGDITAERSRYKADGVSRLGFYRFHLTDKTKPLWLNANGSRKALGNDFVKVSVKAIKTIGANTAVALAKVIHLFLNRAASKGRKGLSIKSLNLAASIIGLPLSTLRRYLANELAVLFAGMRLNASYRLLEGPIQWSDTLALT